MRKNKFLVERNGKYRIYCMAGYRMKKDWYVLLKPNFETLKGKVLHMNYLNSMGDNKFSYPIVFKGEGTAHEYMEYILGGWCGRPVSIQKEDDPKLMLEVPALGVKDLKRFFKDKNIYFVEEAKENSLRDFIRKIPLLSFFLESC